MTQPIRATRENLLPGTIWQNAAGTSVVKVRERGGHYLMTEKVGSFCSVPTIGQFLKSDIWYQVQPIKGPTT